MNLAFIYANYDFLLATITQLETQKLRLSTWMNSNSKIRGNKVEHIINEAL
jgi:hypothetical protein